MTEAASNRDRFTLSDMARAAGHPAWIDRSGAAHFVWGGGEVTLALEGGRPTCDVRLVSSEGALYHRRLNLTSEGANLLATCLSLLWAERGDEGDLISVACEGLIDGVRFDESSALASAWDLLEEVGVDTVLARVHGADEGKHLGWGAEAILHPVTLLRQFTFGSVRKGTEAGQSVSVSVTFPDALVELFLSGDAASTGEGRSVRCLVDGVPADPAWVSDEASGLYLLALQQGLACISGREELADVDDSDFPALREGLASLHGLDFRSGFRRLIELFDPEGRQELAGDLSPGQLTSLATMAMLKRVARRGRGSIGRMVDLERVVAMAGRDLEPVADGWALRFDCVDLTFEVEADVAVGWVRLIDPTRRLQAWPVAFSAGALEHFAWASAAYDVASWHTPTIELAQYMLLVPVSPWFNPELAVFSTLDPLTELADRLDGDDARALREILRRRPSPGDRDDL